MSFETLASLREISLKDAVEFIVDNRGKTAPTEPEGIALIATNCVNNVDLYPQKLNLRYVSLDTYNTWFRSHPVPGDILLTNKGSQNGAICLVPDPVDFCIAQDMVALRADAKKISPLYLFAALRSDLVQKRIKALNVDAVIPHLKKTDFNKLLIPLPDQAVQNSVGQLYFDLSTRIELLRETNATLEAIAQALFKSWFVDFDPVRAKLQGRTPEGMDEATAALFPDWFGESELGLVPRGWRVGTLADCCSTVQSGGTPKRTSPVYWNGNISWLTSGEVRNPIVFDTKEKITELGVKESSAKLWPSGTTVVAMYGATAGEVCLLAQPTTANQACCGLIPRDGFRAFLFFFVRRERENLASKSSGSAQQNLNKGLVTSHQSLIPCVATVVAYENVVGALLDSWIQNEKQAQTLATLRDTLLPRLISGQLRLPEVESLKEKAIL